MFKKNHLITTSLDSELIEELLPDFLSELTVEFENLLAHFNAGNQIQIKNTIHKIRGTAQVFGAFKIEQNAKEIEHVITEKNDFFLLEAIEKMRINIKQMNQEFINYTPQHSAA